MKRKQNNSFRHGRPNRTNMVIGMHIPISVKFYCTNQVRGVWQYEMYGRQRNKTFFELIKILKTFFFLKIEENMSRISGAVKVCICTGIP